MVLKFTILGKVQPKQSTKFGKFGAYQPAKVTNYANWVKMSFWKEHTGWLPYTADIPLKMKIDAYLPIPDSWSEKKKRKAESGEIRPTVKPDTDNIGKMIKDALNGIAYADDRQVVSETITKKYSNLPRVEVEIEGIF